MRVLCSILFGITHLASHRASLSQLNCASQQDLCLQRWQTAHQIASDGDSHTVVDPLSIESPRVKRAFLQRHASTWAVCGPSVEFSQNIYQSRSYRSSYRSPSPQL